MRIQLHPDFAKDIRRFESEYRSVTPALGQRFLKDVTAALDAVKLSPLSAGHYVNTGSQIIRDCRRRNLRAFPFFVLYAVTDEWIYFAAVLPHRSDPLSWLKRF